MIPQRISGWNLTLTPPTTPAAAAEVRPLYVREENGRIRSAWMPTPGELATLLAGGSIVLTLFTHIHPVVAISVEDIPEDLGCSR